MSVRFLSEAEIMVDLPPDIPPPPPSIPDAVALPPPPPVDGSIGASLLFPSESTEVQLEAASSLDVSDTSTGDDTDVPQSMSVGASPETDIRSMSLRSSAGRGEGSRRPSLPGMLSTPAPRSAAVVVDAHGREVRVPKAALSCPNCNHRFDDERRTRTKCTTCLKTVCSLCVRLVKLESYGETESRKICYPCLEETKKRIAAFRTCGRGNGISGEPPLSTSLRSASSGGVSPLTDRGTGRGLSRRASLGRGTPALSPLRSPYGSPVGRGSPASSPTSSAPGSPVGRGSPRSASAIGRGQLTRMNREHSSSPEMAQTYDMGNEPLTNP